MKRLISIVLIIILIGSMANSLADESYYTVSYVDAMLQMLVEEYGKNPDVFDAEYNEMLFVYFQLYRLLRNADLVYSNLELKSNELSGGKGIREDLILNAQLAEADYQLDQYFLQVWKEYRTGQRSSEDFTKLMINIIRATEQGIGDASDTSEPDPTPTPKNLQVGFTDSEAVRTVQRRLMELGFFEGAADGNFDSKTEKAVIDFQKANGLAQTGEVGIETLDALSKKGAITTPDTILYYNPDGGAFYHRDQNCKKIAEKYLPLKGQFRYAEIENEPYNELKPCVFCCYSTD